jgi:hypothetical protein
MIPARILKRWELVFDVKENQLNMNEGKFLKVTKKELIIGI